MRIESADVQMASTHEAVEIHSTEERLRMWGTVPRDAERLTGSPSDSALSDLDTSKADARQRMTGAAFEAELTRFSLSTETAAFSSSSLVKGKGKSSPDKSEKTDNDKVDEALAGDTRLELLRMFVEQFTGEKVHIFRPPDGEHEGGNSDVADASKTGEGTGEGEQVGWGVEYDYRKIEGESERTSFSSSGVVKTADGKEKNNHAFLPIGMTRKTNP